MGNTLTIKIKNFEDFKYACQHFGIEINKNQLEQFNKYCKTLLEWNKKINLISRKEENVLEKHFLDSVLFLPEINDLANRAGARPAPTVFDIGSGGGFPAIPLAIMNLDWQFTLCESIKKKANFLNHAIKELDLKNAIVINARVETCHGMSPHQNKYDFVTVRAVGKLDELIKYSLPLLKKDGYLLAYKSKNIDDEIKNVTLPIQIFSKEINGIERKLLVLSRSQEHK